MKYLAICRESGSDGFLFDTRAEAVKHIENNICIGETWEVFGVYGRPSARCYYKPAPIVVPEAEKVWT